MLEQIAVQIRAGVVVALIMLVNGLIFRFVIPQFENYSLIGYLILLAAVVVFATVKAIENYRH